MREEGDLGSGVGAGGVSVERLAPSFALRVIDLAEIKHLALRDAPVVEPLVFDDTPVRVLLAILLLEL